MTLFRRRQAFFFFIRVSVDGVEPIIVKFNDMLVFSLNCYCFSYFSFDLVKTQHFFFESSHTWGWEDFMSDQRRNAEMKQFLLKTSLYIFWWRLIFGSHDSPLVSLYQFVILSETSSSPVLLWLVPRSFQFAGWSASFLNSQFLPFATCVLVCTVPVVQPCLLTKWWPWCPLNSNIFKSDVFHPRLVFRL